MGSPKLQDVKVNVARMLAAGQGKQTLGRNGKGQPITVRPLVKDAETEAQYGPGYVALAESVRAMLDAAPRTPDGSVTDAAWQHLWETVKRAGDSDPVGTGIYLPSSTGLRHRRDVGIAARPTSLRSAEADVLDGLL